MTDGISPTPHFSNVKNRRLEVNFTGGEVSGDGGALLLKAVDDRLGLTHKLAKCFKDKRDQGKITHSLASMLRQRIYGIALGYEDLNDHNTLRKCPALQTVVGTVNDLASAPTLCRLENQADRSFTMEAHKLMVEQFIASYTTPPSQLILDFDATDDIIHGNQQGKFFHGYTRHYCFLPLYVFCGQKLLVSYLRTSKRDQAKHSWAILSLLVKRLKQSWPEVEIVFRGDGGFCRHHMLNWCDRHKVGYIVGFAKNSRLKTLLEPTMEQARVAFMATQAKQRLFTEFRYAAKSWKCERKVVGKAELNGLGENPRFVVTNLAGDPQALYEQLYCARGNMENRIKEQQLALFADRTSCHDWWPNQFRLLLSSLAYTLVEAIRDTCLHGTELATAQVGTIRLKLFKIGAVIIRNTRRIRFLLSSAYPYQHLWCDIIRRLALK